MAGLSLATFLAAFFLTTFFLATFFLAFGFFFAIFFLRTGFFLAGFALAIIISSGFEALGVKSLATGLDLPWPLRSISFLAILVVFNCCQILSPVWCG